MSRLVMIVMMRVVCCFNVAWYDPCGRPFLGYPKGLSCTRSEQETWKENKYTDVKAMDVCLLERAQSLGGTPPPPTSNSYYQVLVICKPSGRMHVGSRRFRSYLNHR